MRYKPAAILGGIFLSGYIEEEKQKVPILCDCDVLVVGGGVAGIAAALAAARHGARVVLAEREFLLGGLATLGLVTIYLPLCDGMGNQVIFGIGEELLKLSIKHGAEGKYPKAWLDGGNPEERKAVRYEVQFNPHLFAIEAERLLLGEGVKILYGVLACATSVKDGKIRSVIFETKSGRVAIAAKSFVDATGDADICRLADAKTAVFAKKNLLAAWYYYHRDGAYGLKILGSADGIYDDTGAERYSGLDAFEISEMLYRSHEQILFDVLRQRETAKQYWPVAVPAIPQLRMTRRLEGVTVLSDEHPHESLETSVGLTGDWRRSGPVYAIPFEALYGKEIKNLLAAGRCISVTDRMWDVTRVIPCCAVTGQAAGTAAAMSDEFASLDIKALQQSLIKNGVRISP